MAELTRWPGPPPAPDGRKELDVMSQSVAYQPAGVTARDGTHTLFAQTMGYVEVTADRFALGAYLGRDLAGGVGIVAFIAAFACRITAPPGATPTNYRATGRLEDLPANHSPRFLPPLQPSLRTGTEALITAALAWLAT